MGPDVEGGERPVQCVLRRVQVSLGEQEQGPSARADPGGPLAAGAAPPSLQHFDEWNRPVGVAGGRQCLHRVREEGADHRLPDTQGEHDVRDRLEEGDRRVRLVRGQMAHAQGRHGGEAHEVVGAAGDGQQLAVLASGPGQVPAVSGQGDSTGPCHDGLGLAAGDSRPLRDLRHQ